MRMQFVRLPERHPTPLWTLLSMLQRRPLAGQGTRARGERIQVIYASAVRPHRPQAMFPVVLILASPNCFMQRCALEP